MNERWTLKLLEYDIIPIYRYQSSNVALLGRSRRENVELGYMSKDPIYDQTSCIAIRNGIVNTITNPPFERQDEQSREEESDDDALLLKLARREETDILQDLRKGLTETNNDSLIENFDSKAIFYHMEKLMHQVPWKSSD
ncbi:hypothetical protein TNCT_244221 [Trichonephila clavata]|uniref:Uncharacterized protein n=1 Tax=Trichonephila clavata TaxID=2740835 RepID=A0A8X6FDQ2_TRICU|nr:hypothetical protein TNCT_244221 [Trichonephila clavata]